MMKDPNRRRSEEITNSYFVFIEKHVGEVVSGVAPKFMKLDQIARALFVSHKHLTNTVQKETGNHPCHFYDLKIIELAKKKAGWNRSFHCGDRQDIYI